MRTLILALPLAVANCTLPPPDPGPTRAEAMLDLVETCVDAAGEYPTEVAAEIYDLCDPDLARGKTPEQIVQDAARVRELTHAGGSN